MSRDQGPWGPPHLLALPGHTTLGRASSVPSTVSQTPASVPLIPQWPLVAPLPSSPFPWFSKISDLEDPTDARCISSIWMASILSFGKVPQGWILYPQMC